MNPIRMQQRTQATTLICQYLTQHDSVHLSVLAEPRGLTALTRTGLADLMRDLQDQGLVSPTAARATFTAGPRLRYAACTDTALQQTLLNAIENRPVESGYWTDVLLAEYLGRSRDDIIRALVTMTSTHGLQDVYVGTLMIVRPAA